MFERCEQIRPQTPFLLADGIQIPAFQQQSKKTLREIFRLFRSNALSSYETINRSPVGAAKFSKRCLRRVCWTLRLQHHAPMRGSKRHRTVIRASANSAQ